MSYRDIHRTFSQSDIESFQPEMKVGLLATVNEEGLPHLTLISTLRATTPTELVFGQFAEGLSKVNVQKNPKTGFLILTLDRNTWRGKAKFTHTQRSGKEFNLLNNLPMFRYNAYFGIHTVYYLDLIEHYGRELLPMKHIVQAALKTLLARRLALRKSKKEVLNLWTRQLINKMANLKFLAFIENDGYPIIIPIIQAQTCGSEHIIFSTSAFSKDIRAIPQGAPVAFFCMSFDMEDVLLRGIYQGIKRVGGVQCGSITVDWVYSPMPPKPEQIYPQTKLEPVTTF
ncbi:MAG TPA: pyridoxamine 5'-phosphate oxidase family protein [Dehalococcoidia bacterium]|nr:pyridoxamine 5'-phosphate oxidase family protein [Dehalococcoidia bacterium]